MTAPWPAVLPHCCAGRHMLLAQILSNGLMTGLVYVLMALGFTLIFGVMRIVNFAHGELYMLGGFATLILFGNLGWNYYLTVVVAAFGVGLFGVLLQSLLLKHFIGRELSGMIMALAIAITLQAGANIIFGPEEQSVPRPVTGVLDLGAAVVPYDRLVVGGFTLVILAAFWFFLQFTRWGLAMRAVTQDSEMAAVQGVRPGFIHPLAFGIGSLLAGGAGALMAPIYTIYSYMGELPMLKAFVVVILGGLGSIPGAVLGGLLLGLVESFFATMYSTTVATMIGFALVIVILIFRPRGLLGRTA
ncbi:MAG: branched-chain amino acid ABC transporter permease [Hyphomicrobiaceae bacterium]|nr:branched-chain amino acid ABC transporter permease [Hyphomicrobiaceae bacterium]